MFSMNIYMYPEFRLCPMNDTRDRKKKKILNHTFTTILVKTFGTLCVSGEENVFHVDPPFPLNSVGCYKPNTFYRTSTLFEEGGGGVGGKSC